MEAGGGTWTTGADGQKMSRYEDEHVEMEEADPFLKIPRVLNVQLHFTDDLEVVWPRQYQIQGHLRGDASWRRCSREGKEKEQQRGEEFEEKQDIASISQSATACRNTLHRGRGADGKSRMRADSKDRRHGESELNQG